MECPVCYEKRANRKLVCGHEFCASCVKTWYMKGGSCPMCRRKVHYRRMPIKKWNAEAEEEMKITMFQETFDELLETIMQPIKYKICTPGSNVPPTPGFIQKVSDEGDLLTLYRTNMHTHELEDLEKTFRSIKDLCSPDEIDFILNDTDDYYSDRHVNLDKRGNYAERGHMYKFANTDKKRSKVQFRNNGRFR